MQAILFDLDGVFYQQGRMLPGAADTLAWVREAGIPHLFLTNTSSRPRTAVVERLARMGMDVTAEQILTPPVAAVEWARREGREPLALFVAAATRGEFAGLEQLAEDRPGGAAAVVVGDLGDGWDFATLNRAFRLLMDGDTALVALGMTRYWQAGDGLRLDVGPMVAALSYATGREPVVLGKPARGFFDAAVGRLGVARDQVLMVGDDIIGDVQGAQRAGLRGALVRTGKCRPADLEGEVVPDLVLDDIGRLPAWWRDHPAGAG